MDKKYLSIIGGIAVLVILVLFNSPKNISTKDIVNPLGSVQRANEYFATSTSAGWTIKTLKNTPGTLGQIVIPLASNAGIVLYDATTTTNGAIYGTTTIARFATTAVGTYVFDAILTKGLVVEMLGSVGVASTTIMYR